MKRTKILTVFLVGMICMSAISANAGETGRIYFGANVGLFDSVILDTFIRERPRRLVERETFEDRYNSALEGFYLGYKLVDKPKAFINLQAHFNLFNKEFTVETSSSTLTRKLNFSFGIDLQPGFYITSKLIGFFNFSLEKGKFRFAKEGTSSAYDVVLPVFGYGFGGGIGYFITDAFCVKVMYKHDQYQQTEISTTYQDWIGPVKIDTARLSPRYDLFLLCLEYNFGAKK